MRNKKLLQPSFSVSLMKRRGYSDLNVRQLRRFAFSLVIGYIIVNILQITYIDTDFENKIKVGNEFQVFDAVVTIAQSDFTASRLVSMLIQLGGWKSDRPIFVFTNKKKDFNCSHEWDNYDKKNCEEDITFIYTRNLKPTFATNDAEETWKSNKDIRAKWIKTQIFEHIPKEINTILYLDADVEIRAPLAPFEKNMKNQIRKSNGSCNAYYFHGLASSTFGSAFKFNSGISIYFRKKSEQLMKEWAKNIVAMRHIRDQPSLWEAIKSTNSKICRLPGKYLSFKKGISAQLHAFFFGEPRTTFFHYTSAKSTSRMRIPYDGTLF